MSTLFIHGQPCINSIEFMITNVKAQVYICQLYSLMINPVKALLLSGLTLYRLYSLMNPYELTRWSLTTFYTCEVTKVGSGRVTSIPTLLTSQGNS